MTPSGQGSEWAGITGGRLLNAKQNTASRSSHQSSRQVFDRVARAAASTSSRNDTPPPRAQAAPAFPPLQSSSTAQTQNRQGQRSTPWAGSSAAAAPPPAAQVYRGPTSVPGPGAKSKAAAPPNLSRSAFPDLPSTSAPRLVPKGAVKGNQSLRNILGTTAPPPPVWENGSRLVSGTSTPVGNGSNGNGETENTGGGKKKGKGKQKQTLFTLGSFPT